MAAIAAPLRIGEPERDLHRKAGALPRTVPAGEAPHLRVAHLLQRPRREEAASSAGAIEDHVGIAVRDCLLDAQFQETARDLARPGKNSGVHLVLLANVHEDRLSR